MKKFGLALALTTGLATVGAAQTALPDTETGRYALSPIAGGVLRLDTRSGQVSTCKDGPSGWACYTAPDERAALDAEIGRLQTENAKLRTQGTAQDKTAEALPKSDPLPRSADAERKIEIPLPSERDMNRVTAFLEDAWRRLVELAARMQRNADGKI